MHLEWRLQNIAYLVKASMFISDLINTCTQSIYLLCADYSVLLQILDHVNCDLANTSLCLKFRVSLQMARSYYVTYDIWRCRAVEEIEINIDSSCIDEVKKAKLGSDIW